MINTSILIIVITRLPRTSAASLVPYLCLSPSVHFFSSFLQTHTQTHTHTHTLLAIHFKQMYQCSEILNSSFINGPSSAIRADKLSNLRTAEQNHFSMQYCQPGEVPHQYFCQIMSECFLWLPHCKLILLFPWSMRKAEGSTGRISALAMGLKALKHTLKRTQTHLFVNSSSLAPHSH